ncbi:hypothetical protein PV08_10103 [Exophiala spinifera]|uniref:Kinesin light chain n=1 Tax=Exophiala spinifera TaxID=91928 RepID=A0A0D2BHG6_9EURO|nr:uncharacterized protein PV08_10103 [Exophiala spinifera]KIW10804.1 hypothetical protein PV08_10103 [Exophiala spinifera]
MVEEQTLKKDHPHRLASQHELASAYLENGQVEEAAPLLEQVVTISKQTHGEDHPDRLTLEHLLSTIYWDLENRKAAIQMMQHVVEIRRQVLDEDHPDRKNSEDWLKHFESEIGRAEAERMSDTEEKKRDSKRRTR